MDQPFAGVGAESVAGPQVRFTLARGDIYISAEMPSFGNFLLWWWNSDPGAGATGARIQLLAAEAAVPVPRAQESTHFLHLRVCLPSGQPVASNLPGKAGQWRAG